MNTKKKNILGLERDSNQSLSEAVLYQLQDPHDKLCASQYVETALFCFCRLFVVLCHIFSVIWRQPVIKL